MASEIEITPRQTSDSTYRTAFIGDSIVLGMGPFYNKIFVRRFEIEANKLNLTQRVQALNFGIDGYNTIQIYEILRTKVLDQRAFSWKELKNCVGAY